MSESQIKAKKGFAAMDKEKQRQIASHGGKSAQAKGNAHRFNSESGRAAGRKGPLALKEKLGEEGFSEHMARIGKKGGGSLNRIRARKSLPNSE